MVITLMSGPHRPAGLLHSGGYDYRKWMRSCGKAKTSPLLPIFATSFKGQGPWSHARNVVDVDGGDHGSEVIACVMVILEESKAEAIDLDLVYRILTNLTV